MTHTRRRQLFVWSTAVAGIVAAITHAAPPPATSPAATQPAATKAATRGAGPQAAAHPVPSTGPTPVLLNVDAADAAAAGLLLSQQLGIPITLDGNAGLNFHGEPRPYVRAVVDLLNGAGLSFDESAGGVRLIGGGPPACVVLINDTTALVVSRVRVDAQLVVHSAVREPGNYRYQFSVRLVTDPAGGVVGISAADRPDSVDLDGQPAPQAAAGLSSEPFMLPAILGAARGGWPRLPLEVDTPYPARRVTRMNGHVRLWQAIDTASVDLSHSDALSGIVVHGTGVNASVAIDQANGAATVYVKLTGPAVERYRSSVWTDASRNFVRLLGPDEMPLPAEAIGAQFYPATKTLIVRLRPLADARIFLDSLTHVAVRVPTTIKATEVPFEIKDLALPGD